MSFRAMHLSELAAGRSGDEYREAEPTTTLAQQPSLPGAEHVRDQEIVLPPIADVPFSLTPPKNERSTVQPLFLFGDWLTRDLKER